LFLGVKPNKVCRTADAISCTVITPTLIGGGSISWSPISSLAVNPTNYEESILTCGDSAIGAPSKIFLSIDFGSSWALITGNLLAVSGAPVDFFTSSSLIMNVGNGVRAYLVF
jgi:hypothetical protein